jgi:hypothetical protein
MHRRRLTRLRKAFSKFEHFQAAVAFNFAYYGAVRMMPATAAGVEKSMGAVNEWVNACGEQVIR